MQNDRAAAAKAEKVMPIKMGQFGKINPQIEEKFCYNKIETHWLWDTAGIALINSAKNECLLAHVTVEKSDQLWQMLSTADFNALDSCVIACSMKTDMGLLRKLVAFADSLTGSVRLVFASNIASLGYSLEEGVYHPQDINEVILNHSKFEDVVAHEHSNLIYTNWELVFEPVRIPIITEKQDRRVHSPLGLSRLLV